LTLRGITSSAPRQSADFQKKPIMDARPVLFNAAAHPRDVGGYRAKSHEILWPLTGY